MQLRKLCEQQGTKSAGKQPGLKARIAAAEAQLGINSQHKEGDIAKKERETHEECM